MACTKCLKTNRRIKTCPHQKDNDRTKKTLETWQKSKKIIGQIGGCSLDTIENLVKRITYIV